VLVSAKESRVIGSTVRRTRPPTNREEDDIIALFARARSAGKREYPPVRIQPPVARSQADFYMLARAYRHTAIAWLFAEYTERRRQAMDWLVNCTSL